MRKTGCTSYPGWCWPIDSDDLGYALIEGRIDPKGGALVDVRVDATSNEIDQLATRGMEAPLPRYGQGVIDTGAEVTCINMGIAQALAGFR